MKIFHVTPAYPPSRGGIESVVSRLAEAQAKAGNDVTVLTTRISASGSLPESIEMGVKVLRFPYFNVSGHLFSPSILYHLTRLKNDIIHFHGLAFATNIIGCLLNAVPKVCSAYYHPATTYQYRFLMRLAIWVSVKTSPAYHTMIALTEREHEQLTRIGCRSVAVIPVGVDSVPINPPGHQRDTNLILFVGRLAVNKGLPDLINAVKLAAREVPNISLAIVGQDWGELNDLKELAAGASVQINFLGQVEQTVLDRLMRSARVLVLPSQHESFGLVVLESMARGTPAIVSDGVAIEREIASVGCGLTFPYGNVNILAERLVRILKDDVCWQNLSGHAVNFVQDYRWERVVDQMMKIYNQAIKKN